MKLDNQNKKKIHKRNDTKTLISFNLSIIIIYCCNGYDSNKMAFIFQSAN